MSMIVHSKELQDAFNIIKGAIGSRNIHLAYKKNLITVIGETSGIIAHTAVNAKGKGSEIMHYGDIGTLMPVLAGKKDLTLTVVDSGLDVAGDRLKGTINLAPSKEQLTFPKFPDPWQGNKKLTEFIRSNMERINFPAVVEGTDIPFFRQLWRMGKKGYIMGSVDGSHAIIVGSSHSTKEEYSPLFNMDPKNLELIKSLLAGDNTECMHDGSAFWIKSDKVECRFDTHPVTEGSQSLPAAWKLIGSDKPTLQINSGEWFDCVSKLEAVSLVDGATVQIHFGSKKAKRIKLTAKSPFGSLELEVKNKTLMSKSLAIATNPLALSYTLQAHKGQLVDAYLVKSPNSEGYNRLDFISDTNGLVTKSTVAINVIK